MHEVASKSCRLLYVKGLQRVEQVKARIREDRGLSTLELAVLATVLLAGALTFTLAWNGKLQDLVADFESQ